MQMQDIEASVATAVLDELVPSRTRFVLQPRVDQLTTAELFVVLCSAGATTNALEFSRLAIELLLSCHDEVAGQGVFRNVDDEEYARRVRAFVDELSARRAPAALADQFTLQVSDRLAEELRDRFRNRMRNAAAAGVVGESLAIVEAVPPVAHYVWSGHRLSLACQLAAAALLSSPYAARAERGAPPVRHSTTQASGSATVVPKPAAQEAATRVSANIQRWETSQIARERVEAIESLAALGPKAASALPTLRRQLGLTGSDGLRRAEAAWAIGYISEGHPDDVAALQAVLRDERMRVRRIASLSLGQIGTAAQRALPAITESGLALPNVVECITTQSSAACDWVRSKLDAEGPLF